MSSSQSQPTRRILNPSGTNDSLQAQQYTKGELNIDQLHADPIKQFDIWFQHAQDEKVHQPETVTLSTAELPSGRVSARMVYLKEADARGFVIYSNWGTSRKSTDVASNPYAALTFWWHELERQVRIEGPCERMESEESQVYYDTRIRGSRVGAWASQQSKVLRDRAELEGQVADVERKFEGEERIPVPEFWGGLRVKAEMVEFWQGRPTRERVILESSELGVGGRSSSVSTADVPSAATDLRTRGLRSAETPIGLGQNHETAAREANSSDATCLHSLASLSQRISCRTTSGTPQYVPCLAAGPSSPVLSHLPDARLGSFQGYFQLQPRIPEHDITRPR
ncbi:pyridoxamine-phosphate oxidase [Friedmanniomyces endolithicus]|nr:pyridoxamine-phosphate oxidase [Friedmanniomyces endolithicus]